MKYPLMIAVAILIFACNEKNETVTDPISAENKSKAAALSDFLKNDKMRLTKYYSDTAIDYIDTDQVVNPETALWGYVSNWIQDDTYSFDDSGNVTIEQNTKRIETDTSAIIMKKSSVAAD